MDLLFENGSTSKPGRPFTTSYMTTVQPGYGDITEKSTNNQITWIAQPSTKSFWNLLDEIRLSRFPVDSMGHSHDPRVSRDFRSNHPGTKCSFPTTSCII